MTALGLPVAHKTVVIRGDSFLRARLLNHPLCCYECLLKVAPVHTQCLYIPGVLDYLSAEISTSKQKKFNLVTFVDTPGLVDGDMVYPFDVNSAITWLGMSLQLYVELSALKLVGSSNG